METTSESPREELSLAELEQRRRQKRDEVLAGSGKKSEPQDPYPRTVDEQIQCQGPGCTRAFVVPVVYLGPARPMGRKPTLCPDCVAEIARQKAERERAEAAEREREKGEADRLKLLAAMERAGGNPYEYGRLSLDTFQARSGRERALEATREFVGAVLEAAPYAQVRGLYLVGETGTGKTALAHCALRACLEAGMEPGKDVIFDDSLSLIERIRDTYGSDERTWKILEDRWRARVWILDDLMAEQPTPDVVRKLTLIINRREGKPTMITSNEPPAKLTEFNADYFRLQSRLGSAKFRLVRSHGEDARFRIVR